MNLENMKAGASLNAIRGSIKKIFFFRICGMGMGASAQLLKQAGFEVEGADSVFFPPMSTYLEKEKIPCMALSEVTSEVLNKYDLIVVGNSVGKNSQEAQMIESCGVPFTSFPSLIGEFILKNRKVIGIAGTHGKTTTSYYLTQMLNLLGEDTGYLIGGVLLDRPLAFLGTSEYFVIESDEYDTSYFQKYAKFNEYHINNLVLTSLEFDHADIYENVESIETEFGKIIPTIDHLIYSEDYQSAKNVANNKRLIEKGALQSYGLNSKNGPLNLTYKNGKCFFELSVENKKELFETNIIGNQNILNLTSCIYFCLNEGLELSKIKKSLLNLKNVKRRQELRGHYKKFIVIDDFAHHPRSVDLTIDAIQKTYPDKKIFAIVEPSTSTSRSTAFQESFVPSFAMASGVIIANPNIPTNAKQFQNLDYKLLSNEVMKSFNIDCFCFEQLGDLIKQIDLWSQKLTEQSVLLVMGNRTIIGLWQDQKFLSELVV
jgi:UDP-N-acetylmuramate: L-alanyl-gamma-D-glutamyl-meso-diaminopimelate ligase